MSLLSALRSRSKGRALLRYLSNAWVARVPFVGLRHVWYGWLFELGEDANVMMGLIIRQPDGITIGKNSNVNPDCLLDSRGGEVRIGKHCNISPQVNIWTLQHDIRDPHFGTSGGPVVVGDFVFVGNRAIILPAVELGEGCVVAAGAVVTESVAPYTVVGGVPARPIGTRPRPVYPPARYRPVLL